MRTQRPPRPLHPSPPKAADPACRPSTAAQRRPTQGPRQLDPRRPADCVPQEGRSVCVVRTPLVASRADFVCARALSRQFLTTWATKLFTADYREQSTWEYFDRVGLMHTGVAGFKHREKKAPLFVDLLACSLLLGWVETVLVNAVLPIDDDTLSLEMKTKVLTAVNKVLCVCAASRAAVCRSPCGRPSADPPSSLPARPQVDPAGPLPTPLHPDRRGVCGLPRQAERVGTGTVARGHEPRVRPRVAVRVPLRPPPGRPGHSLPAVALPLHAIPCVSCENVVMRIVKFGRQRGRRCTRSALHHLVEPGGEEGGGRRAVNRRTRHQVGQGERGDARVRGLAALHPLARRGSARLDAHLLARTAAGCRRRCWHERARGLGRARRPRGLLDRVLVDAEVNVVVDAREVGRRKRCLARGRRGEGGSARGAGRGSVCEEAHLADRAADRDLVLVIVIVVSVPHRALGGRFPYRRGQEQHVVVVVVIVRVEERDDLAVGKLAAAGGRRLGWRPLDELRGLR